MPFMILGGYLTNLSTSNEFIKFIAQLSPVGMTMQSQAYIEWQDDHPFARMNDIFGFNRTYLDVTLEQGAIALTLNIVACIAMKILASK